MQIDIILFAYAKYLYLFLFMEEYMKCCNCKFSVENMTSESAVRALTEVAWEVYRENNSARREEFYDMMGDVTKDNSYIIRMSYSLIEAQSEAVVLWKECMEKSIIN